MANYRRAGARARQQAARQRRLLLIIGGATVLVIAALVLLLLPRGGAPDRAVETVAQPAPTQSPDSAPKVAEGVPLVRATPTPAPGQAQGGTVSFASLRAATRPTPTAPGYGLVFSEADTEEKIIAITVDDCFQADNLQQIVDTAISVGGKLTIFPIGKNVLKKKQSEILKYAWENGFELENHTFTHNGLYKCSDEELADE